MADDQPSSPRRRKSSEAEGHLVTKRLYGDRNKRPFTFLDRMPDTLPVADFAGRALELRKGVLTESHGGGAVEPGIASDQRRSYVSSFLRRPMFLPVPPAPRADINTTIDGKTEAVILADERQPVTQTTSVPWRAICQLEIRRQTGVKAVGTGWFAGPRTVVTAGHCLFDPRNGGYATEVLVVPGRQGNAAPLGFDRAIDLHVHPQWVRTHDSAWDIAALTMRDTALGGLAGYFDIGVFPDEVLNMHLVNNGGYPVDGQKPYGTMWSGFGRIERMTDEYLYYQIDTSEGQSGSPIFHYDALSQRRIVLGVHTSFIEYNRAVRITSEVMGWLNSIL